MIQLFPDLSPVNSARQAGRSEIPQTEELRERIKRKAHELYEYRGGQDGDDWADWFAAEKIVRSGLGFGKNT